MNKDIQRIKGAAFRFPFPPFRFPWFERVRKTNLRSMFLYAAVPRQYVLSCLCILILLTNTKVSYAADPVLKKEPSLLGLQGLVIDKTLTPPARQFYREFARQWWDQEKQTSGNIVVRELPNALRGSQISILFNRTPMFVTVLSPARNDINNKATFAVNAVDRKIKMSQLSRLFENNPDLASDEF